MSNHTFYQLDVFTDTPFTGNPLAVFPEADGISDADMQSIANEMNLSETVFVLPSDKALRRLRIFTPMQELPLAGHPVVGTWNLLARLGITQQEQNGSIEIEQELNLGVLPVEIEFQDGEPFRVTMTQGKWQSFGRISDATEISKFAAGLGLELEDLDVDQNLPIEIVSTGIRSIDIPICTLEALGRIRVNSSLLADAYSAHGAVGAYAFTLETKESGSLVHARFFAPADNIAEDAATGSAAGALSGYLVHHGAAKTNSFVIEQGDFMRRPGRIHAEVLGGPGNIERVKIGGSSVLVAKGAVFLISCES